MEDLDEVVESVESEDGVLTVDSFFVSSAEEVVEEGVVLPPEEVEGVVLSELGLVLSAEEGVVLPFEEEVVVVPFADDDEEDDDDNFNESNSAS